MTAGFLVLDKPAGLTSHDMVGMARAFLGEKRIGHTGTLDPFATGVLVLALNHATRLIQFLDERRKVYDLDIVLGERTDTGDRTGEVVQTAPVPHLDAARVQEVLASFVGIREQRPPAYSAVKVEGRKLYEYARAGKPVEAAPRPVALHEVRLLGLGEGTLSVRLDCSKGTYARVVAEEIGEALGTVAHTRELRRQVSGPFTLDGALDMPTLADVVAVTPGQAWMDVLRSGRLPREQRPAWRSTTEIRAALAPRVVDPNAALQHLPSLTLDAAELDRTLHGQAPRRLPPGIGPGDRYRLVKPVGDGLALVAVVEAGPRGGHMVVVDDGAFG
jgi:tRNA pseudouridine(55) synthase